MVAVDVQWQRTVPRLDLEAPDFHGIVDADVPGRVDGQVSVNWHVADAASRETPKARRRLLRRPGSFPFADPAWLVLGRFCASTGFRSARQQGNIQMIGRGAVSSALRAFAQCPAAAFAVH
jgi:hypothetical protein